MNPIVISGIGAARIEKCLPGAFRLVTKEDGNGNVVYVLQGCFAWTQGMEYGSEWRDLETQDWLHAKDNIPFGLLPLDTFGGPTKWLT